MKSVRFALAALFFGLVSSCSMSPALADEKTYACGTVEANVVAVQTHPAYVAHVILTGAEASRGVRAIDANGPELEAGLLILRSDGAVILFGFKADGACGSMVVGPEHAERLWKVIKGTVS